MIFGGLSPKFTQWMGSKRKAFTVAAILCAVFSTLFTDKVLGNAKLAGFSLTITAVLSLVMMTAAHCLFPAMGV